MFSSKFSTLIVNSLPSRAKVIKLRHANGVSYINFSINNTLQWLAEHTLAQSSISMSPTVVCTSTRPLVGKVDIESLNGLFQVKK